MKFTLSDVPIEPNLEWSNQGRSTWEATGAHSTYRLTCLPKPIDRWVVNIDGKRELDKYGETLMFWYRDDAKKHCREREYGRSGFTESQGQTPR